MSNKRTKIKRYVTVSKENENNKQLSERKE